MMGKFRAFVLAMLCMMLCMGACSAEPKIIVATGQYLVGDGEWESVDIAQERAKSNAIRNAVQKAGVYVVSYSKTKDFQIVEDEARFVAGTALEVLEETCVPEPIEDSMVQYKSTVRVMVDLDGIMEKVKNQEREALEKNMQSYNELLKRSQEIAEENEQIRKKYTATVWDEGSRSMQRAELAKNDEKFEAVQLLMDGIGCMERGETAAALAAIEKSLRANPYEIAYVLRGNLRLDARETDAAIADYTKAIEMNPYLVDAFYKRGIAYETKGSAERALEDYGKAISMGARVAGVYGRRGAILLSRGNPADAVSDLRQAADMDSVNYIYQRNLGIACYQLGDYRGALKGLSLAISLGDVDASTYLLRGNAFDRIGSYGNAVHDYTIVLQKQPGNAEAAQQKELAYQKGQQDSRDISEGLALSAVRGTPSIWASSSPESLEERAMGVFQRFNAVQADCQGTKFSERYNKDKPSKLKTAAEREQEKLSQEPFAVQAGYQFQLDKTDYVRIDIWRLKPGMSSTSDNAEHQHITLDMKNETWATDGEQRLRALLCALGADFSNPAEVREIRQMMFRICAAVGSAGTGNIAKVEYDSPGIGKKLKVEKYQHDSSVTIAIGGSDEGH